MPDQADLVQAIYNAIFSSLGTAPAATASSYVSLEWPGMPIEASDFVNPWTATNTTGSPASTENFSLLVDAIPSASPVYTPSGVGIESVYSLILAATVGGASGPIAEAFANAQLTFAGSALGSAQSPSNSYHPSYAQPSGWCSSNTGWATVSTSLSATVAAGVQHTPPPAPIFANAVKEILKLQPAVLGWQAAAVNVAALHKIAPPIQVHPIAASPIQPMRPLAEAGLAHAADLSFRPALMTAAPAMARPAVPADLSLATRNRVVQIRSANELLAAPAATVARVPASSQMVVERMLRLPTGLQPVHPLPVAELPASPPQVKAITSSSLKLTLQCQRVTIQRPWLNALLFHLGGWSIDGMAEGSLSSVAPPIDPAQNTGFFPLLPLSFVVVKDVALSGTWSADDKTFATRATTPGNVVAFGPLTLSNPAATQSTFDGQTLNVPGMQIVAWISSPNPVLPPTA